MLASAALVVAPNTARADDFLSTLPVTPMVLSQFDATAHPQSEEGQNGFSIPRFRAGLWARPTDWSFAIANVEFANSESPNILDGYVTFVPIQQFRITLGYSRNPLFLSARSELEGTQPMPELSMPVKALWPGRDLGIDVHYIPHSLPLEAWARIGNGVNGPLGKAVTDSGTFAYTFRLDATMGRASFRPNPRDFFGLRVGLGAYFENTADRAGTAGTTEGGYVFYQPPTINGDRSAIEGHALAFVGPVRALVEVGFGRENRSTNETGANNGKVVDLDPPGTRGISGELSWMITGQHRVIGIWPVHSGNRLFSAKYLGLELAARVERLDLGRDTRDLPAGGATSGSTSLTAWFSDTMSLAVAGYIYQYDIAPIDEPGRTSSWLLQSRFTLYLNPPPPSNAQTKTDSRHVEQ